MITATIFSHSVEFALVEVQISLRSWFDTPPIWRRVILDFVPLGYHLGIIIDNLSSDWSWLNNPTEEVMYLLQNKGVLPRCNNPTTLLQLSDIIFSYDTTSLGFLSIVIYKNDEEFVFVQQNLRESTYPQGVDMILSKIYCLFVSIEEEPTLFIQTSHIGLETILTTLKKVASEFQLGFNAKPLPL